MNTHKQPKNSTPLGLVGLLCIPMLAIIIAFVVYNARNPLPDPPVAEETGTVELGPSDAGGAEPAPSDGGGESGTGLIGDIPEPVAPASPEATEETAEEEPVDMGVDPAEVAIPEEVTQRFEGANTEAAPALVVALQSKSLPAAKSDEAANENATPTVEQTLAPVWSTLSPSMQEYATDQHDIWTSPDSTKAQKDAAYKNIFALTPIAPHDNTYVLDNSESVQVDAKGKWGAYLYNMEVIGTDVGLSGEEGMVISLDRWIDIPLTNDEFDITIGTNIIYTLVPNPDNKDEWLIDGVSWHSAPAEKVNK